MNKRDALQDVKRQPNKSIHIAHNSLRGMLVTGSYDEPKTVNSVKELLRG